MIFVKKSLGQNFLIDKNIIKKIINLTEFKNKNIIEIGPGKGALTNEILNKNPKSLTLIEKDLELANHLKEKYLLEKKVKVINCDILDFKLEETLKRNSIIIGNLPYNISSQILVKILKFKKWLPKFENLIFMFQKELGEKIIGKYLTKDYGRISILTNYRLNTIEKFLVSPNCFRPRPKVTSIVIHFKPIKREKFKIKKIDKLEKITNILFSAKRKMINKKLQKILNTKEIKKINGLQLNLRPTDLEPNIYYKITEIFEKK